MFELFEPVPLSNKAPRWAARVANTYPLVFGISSFGHLFVTSADSTRFAMILTDRPELVELKVSSMAEFVSEFLGNESAREFFRESDATQLTQRLGPLEPGECFFPAPYPAIGGSGKLETYQRGDCWAHLDIYAQTIGI